MLTRRTLELRADAATLTETHLPSAVIADCGRAAAVIARAEAQAAALLAEAEARCEARQAQLEQTFWQRANVLLDAWEAQRAAENAALEEVARDLVNAALSQLLATVPPTQQLDALLRQLLLSQRPLVPGELRCAPDLAAPVADWCAQRPELPWQPLPDSRLPPGQVLLRTDTGDLQLDWAHAVSALQLPESAGKEPLE